MADRRHLISIDDLSDDDLRQIIRRGTEFAAGSTENARPLADAVVGVLFRKTSTRTRTAFSAGALRLGARLIKLDPNSPFETYAKLEGYNPGGSIKDRAAIEMLRELIRDGQLVPGRSVVVESSSGNLGIGLAQVCGYHGIRFVCVVDPRTNRQSIAIMRALGAEVEMITDVDPATGEYLPARIRRVRELVATIDHAYCPDQYSNPRNAWAHRTTVRELLSALPRLDYLFCATSSCGAAPSTSACTSCR